MNQSILLLKGKYSFFIYIHINNNSHYHNKIATNKHKTINSASTDKKSRLKNSDVSTILSSSDKSSVCSNKHNFKSKSVEKDRKNNDEMIRASSSKIIKVNSLKNIRKDNCSFFSIAEFNPHYKNQKAKTYYYSILSKAINHSSALVINEKVEKNKFHSCSNYNSNNNKEKEKEYSSEKKKNTLISSTTLEKNSNLVSNNFGGINKSNNHANIYSNFNNKNQRDGRGISKMNTKKANRTKSVAKTIFHYSELYKERINAIINRNSSINSLKQKKQCV